MKFKKNRKYIFWLIGIIFIFFVICLFVEINSNMNINQIEFEGQNNLSSSMVSLDVANNIQLLQKEYNNDDIIGILSIDLVDKFSYPIVQGNDNEYYLEHDYYKKKDKLGALYLDYRVDLNKSKKFLIYGHSSVKSDTYFNGLEKYYDEDYYKEHKYITFETETNVYKYEIFSVYVETNDFTYMNMNFDSDNDWYLHLLKLQAKSLYKTGVVLDSDDDILILQTCSNNSDYQNYSKKYLLVISRRVL